MRRAVISLAVAAVFAVALVPTASPAVRLAQVAKGYDQPIFLTSNSYEQKRLYIVEQTGRVRILQAGKKLRSPFLDLHTRVVCCGEQGLLSMVFHPEYPKVRRVYVNYTNRSGDTRVVEYQVNPQRTKVMLSTARVLLSIGQPYSNHNGGQLLFGLDKKLYVPTGDGGDAGDPGNRAQNITSRLGKLLRIDPATKDVTVVAVGLRNPWRVSLDRTMNRFMIGDVGQDRREEIDIWRPNATGLENFGWRRYEGSLLYNGSTSLYSPSVRVGPIHQYPHTDGACAVTGGYVYRGRSLEGQRGRYFFGDYCNGKVWSFKIKNGKRVSFRSQDTLRVSGGLSSFGEGPNKELYLVSLSGRIYRVARSG